jgi:hypothetical protein
MVVANLYFLKMFYLGLVILKKELDYETLSSYHLVLEVRDQGEDTVLSASTAIFIQVIKGRRLYVDTKINENLFFPQSTGRVATTEYTK